ncbi:uroporphyrinogen decarboxylase [Cytobacillus pseudoceanisediminis]|jgi:uroporphyrinogen decarboxylase|uniref:Uroporphyrinogen decarboxylase n=3 Tax=Cytobacillus TaxID=2675230 RepID=A0A160M9Q1_9BACI|nr:uroporphyrinogen decarboxylase [Cytobacillus oceanisediminis]MCS0825028.1 uroporphyrinogen decarboxylase [Cytobacillus firmus]AND38878.1 uroporphyrinogen decarboxylase [Cytobacillus oceanisediminis 2691]MBU8732031.1 uroporphyrinogen decarboxylase [Cytobacillus oceanisediminis]MCM3241272.1 uroporphyrinogen decarboxylase [Cytobacillus oceanisediminis]OHX47619.1 uroporphyrinogen decarboxylase [Cytobacillus oceanisediminis]
MTNSFNDTFLKAARGEQTDYVPVWYMRQAGRSQPEYRAIKEKYSLFEITHQPELCAYVTRLPVEQYNNDAAILYKDIMSPLPALGVDVEIKSGIGPVISNPIRSIADVEKLGEINPEEDVPYVLETIKLLTQEQLTVPLIGFAGAPFTIASYMIEGGPSKNYNKTKAFMYAEPKAWFALMDKLGEMTITYVKSQVKAGAKAIQIFDSWVGALNVEDYRYFIKPVMNRIFSALKEENVPLIMFGVGASHLALEWHDLPLDVVGLDWRLPIQEARAKGITKTVQGNLDPAILLAPWEVIEEKAKAILDQGMAQPGYIFNLGHGVFPEVNPDTLKKLTAFIHEYSASKLNK